ncbi:MAG: hypothetical protein HXY34_10075 [Candidatus Thorarchaeota archaeon]|nr:hypothetical protein [Candidatus Thorarchaeota archaeon]
MKRVKIVPDRAVYSPGETLVGQVIVECDKTFSVNSVSIALVCEERSIIEHGSGNNRHTHVDKTKHIDLLQGLADACSIDPGVHAFDFAFRLPANLPATYHGPHGHVTYTLNARAERPLRLDLRCQLDVQIESPVTYLSPKACTGEVVDGETRLLTVELSHDVLSPGEPFRLSIMSLTDTKMRGVRVEAISKETVSPDGNFTETETVICGYFVDKSQLVYGTWVPVTLWMPRFAKGTVFRPSHLFPRPFESVHIKYEYLLKVTIDRPLRRDASVFLPLRLGLVGSEEDFLEQARRAFEDQ